MLKIIENEIKLSDILYYKMGGLVKYFCEPTNIQDFFEAINYAKINNIDIAVVGEGTNLAISQAYLHILLIKTTQMNKIFFLNDNLVFIEGGALNTQLSLQMLEKKISGFEWLYYLPGTIGASVKINAKCYDNEMSMFVQEIFYIDQNGYMQNILATDFFYGYKQTFGTKNICIIVAVILKYINHSTKEIIWSKMLDYKLNRDKKHQFDYPSCGSTFKNNYDIAKSCGVLFDEMGFKGFKYKNLEVSNYHANFIWNKTNSCAEELLELIKYIQHKVYIKINKEVEPEVEFLGEFDENLFKETTLKNKLYYKKDNNIFLGIIKFTNNNEEKIIYKSKFLNYYNKSFMNNIYVEIKQFINISEAKQNPQCKFIEWSTVDNVTKFSNFNIIPLASDEHEYFKNYLWEHSVSELFIASNTTTEYDEFEISPHKFYVAISYSAERIRAIGHNDPSSQYWKNIELIFNNNKCSMIFSYEQISKFIDNNKIIKFQCAISLGNNKYYLSPWWSDISNHDVPDFHKLNKYCQIKLY